MGNKGTSVPMSPPLVVCDPLDFNKNPLTSEFTPESVFLKMVFFSHPLYRQAGFSQWQYMFRVIKPKTYNKWSFDDRKFNWLILMPKGATLYYEDDYSSHFSYELIKFLCICSYLKPQWHFETESTMENCIWILLL